MPPGVARRAVFGPLLWPSLRTIGWLRFGVIVALGVVVVRSGGRNDGDPATVALPIATTMLGIWLSMVFEDTASEITRPSPVPLWLRRAVRVSIAIAATGVAWFTFTWLGPLDGATLAMSEMAAAVAVVALACAAVATRLVPPARSGMVAAAGLVGVVHAVPFAIAALLERPISIDPSHVAIGDPFTYWVTMSSAAIAVLVLAHRDSALPPFRVSILASARRAPLVPARGSR